MSHYEYLFPTAEDTDLLIQTTALINSYAEMGLMLGQTIDRFIEVAARGMLVLAVDEEGKVVGSAGLTYKLPLEGTFEFGAWAVDPNLKGGGVGKELYRRLLQQASNDQNIKRVIAYTNNNSAPILKKMGGVVIDQTTLPDGMFSGCVRCKCLGKEHLHDGQRCVDQLLELTLAEEK